MVDVECTGQDCPFPVASQADEKSEQKLQAQKNHLSVVSRHCLLL